MMNGTDDMSEANDAAAPLFFERMERFYDL